MIITNHASGRMKERLGIKSLKRMEAMAKRAYYSGIRENECDCQTRKVFERLSQNANYENIEAVIYHDQAFIFSEKKKLVTVCPAPTKYKRIMERKRAKNRTNRALSTD